MEVGYIKIKNLKGCDFMMNTKKSKRILFGELLALDVIQSNEEYKNFIQHEIELLEKKASNKVTTANQKENAELKEIILATLETIGTPVTISDLQSQSDKLSKEKYSNQKISALLTQLKNDGKVINTKDKKKSYFTVA